MAILYTIKKSEAFIKFSRYSSQYRNFVIFARVDLTASLINLSILEKQNDRWGLTLFFNWIPTSAFHFVVEPNHNEPASPKVLG